MDYWFEGIMKTDRRARFLIQNDLYPKFVTHGRYYDKTGMNLFLKALKHKNHDAAYLLLRAGADIHSTDNLGRSLAQLIGSDVESSKHMTKAEVDPKIRDRYFTCLQIFANGVFRIISSIQGGIILRAYGRDILNTWHKERILDMSIFQLFPAEYKAKLYAHEDHKLFSQMQEEEPLKSFKIHFKDDERICGFCDLKLHGTLLESVELVDQEDRALFDLAESALDFLESSEWAMTLQDEYYRKCFGTRLDNPENEERARKALAEAYYKHKDYDGKSKFNL